MGILTDEMKHMVQEQQLGFVATVCPDNTPNLSPKGTTTVWDDDNLIFADICSPATIENLRHNPASEINVVDPFIRKGYRFKGTATILTEDELFEQALAFYRNRGSTSTKNSIVLVKVERAAPLVSPAYDTRRTETEVFSQWQEYWAKINREKQQRYRF